MSETNPIQHADDTNFDEIVLNGSLPCVVDFWAPWCGPCKMLNPTISAAAERWAGKVQFVKVNVDDSPNTAGKYNVRGIPTLILFDQGEAKDTKVGMMTPPELDQFIEKSTQE